MTKDIVRLIYTTVNDDHTYNVNEFPSYTRIDNELVDLAYQSASRFVEITSPLIITFTAKNGIATYRAHRFLANGVIEFVLVSGGVNND